MLTRLARTAFATALAFLALAAWADAQDKDVSRDQANRLKVVAAQKLEADVRAALSQSQRRAASPDKAVEPLKAVLARLEDDTTLPEQRRQALIRMLTKRMDAITSGADAKAPTEKDLLAQIRRFEDRKEQGEKRAEDEKFRRALNHVIDLQKNGKLAEAKREAEELARQYPSNAAAKNLLMTAAAFDQLASARRLRADKEDRFAHALRDVQRSATPPKDDIEFPKDWKERTKGRTANRIQLTPKEQAIMRALSSPITVNFKDDRFQDVMEYLSTALGQPIILTKADLEDATVNYDTPVTLAGRGVSARLVLRKILGQFGLTYVIKDEAIQVVSALKARDMMVTRAYYVGDLMSMRGGPGDPWTYVFGPGLQQAFTAQSIASLIDMVQSSVDPQSWQANGGPGAVYFHYPTMSIVVKQSAEVHAMMGGGLLR